MLGVVLFFALTMPFKHINHPSVKTELSKLKKDSYNKIINKFDDDFNLFVSQLDEVDQVKFNQIAKTKAEDLKIYHSNKTAKKEEYKYKGYSSYRYFLYAVGIPFCLLILSFRYWYLILSKNEENRYKKIFLNIEAFAFSYVALYWLAWVSFTNTDFDLKYYKFSYIIITVIILVVVYFIIKAVIYSENKKLRIIQYLNQEIFKDIKNDFISLFDNEKYKKKYFERCSEILNKQVNM